jgi:hypothetical protein
MEQGGEIMTELVALVLFVVGPIAMGLYVCFHGAPKHRNSNKKGLA